VGNGPQGGQKPAGDSSRALRLSEVEVAAVDRESGALERRPPWGLILGAALVIVLAIAGVLFAQYRAVRARFLIESADSIPGDPELLQFAMARGASGYAEHCASCHGAHLEGDRKWGVPNLADSEWLYGTGRVTEIERVVLYGIRSGNSKGWDLAHMPAFATPHPYNLYALAPLTPAAIADVTTYILSFQSPQSDAAAVERGSRIFRDPSGGNCVDCHGPDGKGDSAIGAPDLTDGIWLSGDGSRESIEYTIGHGLAGHCPSWVTQLSPVTVRAIAVYVHATAVAGTQKPGPDARGKLE
jgi:cytochrome c oxidase cbb3-type subunit III